MQQSSILDVNNHALGLCCTSTVNTADCAAPIKFIHAVSVNRAGYFFTAIAYKVFKKASALVDMAFLINIITGLVNGRLFCRCYYFHIYVCVCVCVIV